MHTRQQICRIDHGKSHEGMVHALRIFGKAVLVVYDNRTHGEWVLSLLRWRIFRRIRKAANRAVPADGSVLYFDHTLGGGTDSYFRHTRADWQGGQGMVRVQYALKAGVYRVSIYDSTGKGMPEFHVPDWQSLEQLFTKVRLSTIVVSNLVGYDTPNVLAGIERLICATHPGKVYFLCHNYYAVCPSYNLMRGNRYCGAETRVEICRKCIAGCLSQTWPANRKIFMPGRKDIVAWRKVWGHFLKNCVTEVIAFDPSVRDIFCKYYPDIRCKTSVVPHQMPPLRKVQLRTRKNGITLAVLGNIFQIKGRDVLVSLDRILPEYPDVHIVLLGTSDTSFKHIRTYGTYQVEELPDLVEKLEVRGIFIPSVCPETFSYTTSESLMMGLPTICFDLGAPANRISKDSKGLVLPLGLADQPRELLRRLTQHIKSV